jgi:hypothetical protein
MTMSDGFDKVFGGTRGTDLSRKQEIARREQERLALIAAEKARKLAAIARKREEREQEKLRRYREAAQARAIKISKKLLTPEYQAAHSVPFFNSEEILNKAAELVLEAVKARPGRPAHLPEIQREIVAQFTSAVHVPVDINVTAQLYPMIHPTKPPSIIPPPFITSQAVMMDRHTATMVMPIAEQQIADAQFDLLGYVGQHLAPRLVATIEEKMLSDAPTIPLALYLCSQPTMNVEVIEDGVLTDPNNGDVVFSLHNVHSADLRAIRIGITFAYGWLEMPAKP